MKPPVIAVTGINATDNPAPGTGIARSLHEDNQLSYRIIGLAYDAMEPGLYMNWLFERCFLMPYPSSTPEVLIERLRQIQLIVGLDCVIPNFDVELPLYIRDCDRCNTFTNFSNFRRTLNMQNNYEKPAIKKLHSGLMNKIADGTLLKRKIQSEIDGVAIDDLVKQFGSPLFVYSEQTLRQKFRTIHDAFSSRYPNVIFGWSYKTNYLKAICAIFHSCGAIAELVSKMEYDKAQALGIPGNQIILNGPHKPFATLQTAVKDGVTINIDHLDEVEDLEAIATSLGKT